MRAYQSQGDYLTRIVSAGSPDVVSSSDSCVERTELRPSGTVGPIHDLELHRATTFGQDGVPLGRWVHRVQPAASR